MILIEYIREPSPSSWLTTGSTTKVRAVSCNDAFPSMTGRRSCRIYTRGLRATMQLQTPSWEWPFDKDSTGPPWLRTHNISWGLVMDVSISLSENTFPPKNSWLSWSHGPSPFGDSTLSGNSQLYPGALITCLLWLTNSPSGSRPSQ
jgi:hypothetical protein